MFCASRIARTRNAVMMVVATFAGSAKTERFVSKVADNANHKPLLVAMKEMSGGLILVICLRILKRIAHMGVVMESVMIRLVLVTIIPVVMTMMFIGMILVEIEKRRRMNAEV